MFGSCNYGDVPSRRFMLGLLVLCVFIACAGKASAQDDTRILVKAKHVITGTGTDFSPGQILITGGKITFVGESVELALPAETIEVDTVMPGIVNAMTDYGLTGGGAEVSREITPDFDTLASLDWKSRDFKEALDGGETTVQILPNTESVFAGLATIVKTAGETESRILSESSGMVLSISSDPTSGNRSRTRPDSIYVRQPTNRMGVVWIIRSALQRAASGELDMSAEATELLNFVTQGEIPVLSVSRADFDIRSALTLGQDHGFSPTIYGGHEVYRILDEFAQSNAPLVFTGLENASTTVALRGREGTELRWNVPGKLAAANVQFCLAGESLLDQARFAVRFGLERQAALSAISLQPAKILGLDSRIGSLESEKDADIVAFSGDPLKPSSAILWTMIDGRIQTKAK